jgi:hypothetical protein
MVKYIAKSAAKNISSLASHTIVPTATALGRVIFWCATALDIEEIIPEIRLGVSLAGLQDAVIKHGTGETDHVKSASPRVQSDVRNGFDQ